MIFTLRPYQQEAVDATLNHFRRHKTPAVIVLPTGAGKSLVIAELARLARGRVLVLAHVKELVAQNHAKYQALGLEADIFAAGLKRKESHGKVVFGSVQSVARNLDAFQGEFSLLIVDECHRIGDDEESQYQQILTHLTKVNPHLRLLGLTATPFRLGKGWIYQFHYHGMVRGDEKALFRDCIYELPLRYMIKHGYLTPPERLDMPVVQYDFSRLQAQSNGLFSEADLNRELKKQQRITPHIISQIMEFAEKRKGVMIFAATVEHAKEIVGLLPAEDAALITGDTPGAERDVLIEDFKAQRFRYLVNVAVLTTGFDAPHVDLIAILRPTESVSLYQQIVGRGLRLGKHGRNDLGLRAARAVVFAADHAVKEPLKIEPLQNRARHRRGLPGRDRDAKTVRTQPLEQFRNAGIERALIDADRQIPLPVACDRRLRLLRRHGIQLRERIEQRRTDKLAQARRVRLVDAEALECILHAAQNALAGVKQRAVKIK